MAAEQRFNDLLAQMTTMRMDLVQQVPNIIDKQVEESMSKINDIIKKTEETFKMMREKLAQQDGAIIKGISGKAEGPALKKTSANSKPLKI